MRMRTLVRIASWAGVVFIASIAFWVSYHAIKGVWITSGAGRPQDAWAIPLLIDGLIVVGSLVGLTRALDGVRGGWVSAHPWALVFAATVVSLVANIAHATSSLGAQAMAALIPLILFAATELVIGEFRRTSKHIASVRIVEEGHGIAPVPVTGGNPATGSDDLRSRLSVPSASGVGVGSPAAQRATAGVGHTAPTRQVGDVEGRGGRAGPGGGAVPGVGADESASSSGAGSGPVGPDPGVTNDADRDASHRGPMSIDAAIRHLIDVGVMSLDDMRPSLIMRHIHQLTGNPNITRGSVGNRLSEARKHAANNGGMRVR